MRWLFAALLAALPLPGEAACRLALALALDVSGSVDVNEYRLQMSGVATALGEADVEAAMFALPEAPVALAVYEWSSSRYQRIVQDWVLITDRTVLGQVRERLFNWERERAPEATGLGAAIEFGGRLLSRSPQCWTETLDVSGDGKNNDWPNMLQVKTQGTVAGLRINGLAIAEERMGNSTYATVEASELSAYFRARVIQGPDAFVEVALGFEDYADAMRRKLLKELKAQPIGKRPDADRTPTRSRLAANTRSQ